MDHRLLDAAVSLAFIAKHEHVLLVGPAGVGKSFLAQALGYAAIRAGYTVRTDARNRWSEAGAISFASGALAHYAEDSNPFPYGKQPSNPFQGPPSLNGGCHVLADGIPGQTCPAQDSPPVPFGPVSGGRLTPQWPPPSRKSSVPTDSALF